jgi:hypothetical protein
VEESKGDKATEEDLPKITFEEYEAFLNKLDKENRLEKMELSNPRSALYKEMMESKGKIERPSK